MPNVNAVLAQEIVRLAKRVVKNSTLPTRKLVTQHRRNVAALKRQVASLTKRLASVEKYQPRSISAPPEVLEKSRFRAVGVKAHRAKLNLSAKDYGKLVGVSPLTVYQWENGKSRPRPSLLAKWLAVRPLGKREAYQQLGLADPTAEPAAKASPKGTRKRGSFAQTADEMILSLLKGRKALSSTLINAAWAKSGRAGRADNSLSIMVRAKKLKREKIKGERGSLYRAA